MAVPGVSFPMLRPFLTMVLSLALVAAEPVVIGLDAEFGHKASQSAQAIEHGARIALAELNAAGGVLGGRPLRLETRDNRSLPARAEANLRELAALPEVVAVIGGKFSNALLPCVPLVHELGLPLLLPWSSADGIIDHGRTPSWTFRLSLKDSWVVPALLARAAASGFKHPGLLLPANSWGRSNQIAAEKHLASTGMAHAGFAWYPFGATTMAAPYNQLRANQADVLILVANESEGAVLVQELAQRPTAERLPLICHWGLTGGDFTRLTGPALAAVDLQVVQTFSFISAVSPARDRVLAALIAAHGATRAEDVPAPIGTAQAYDLVHLLAQAIQVAGSTDRRKIRDALEHLGPHDGLIRRYAAPWTPERHEALDPSAIIFCRWDPAGVLRPSP